MGSRRRRGVGRSAEPKEEAEDTAAESVEASEPSEEKSEQPEPEKPVEKEESNRADLLREPKGPIDGAGESFGGPPPPAVARPPKHPLTMGPNKSVASRRGQLNDGDEVRESDFDEKTLARLIEIGCVIDNRK